jgi:hypothetical protein
MDNRPERKNVTGLFRAPAGFAATIFKLDHEG